MGPCDRSKGLHLVVWGALGWSVAACGGSGGRPVTGSGSAGATTANPTTGPTGGGAAATGPGTTVASVGASSASSGGSGTAGGSGSTIGADLPGEGPGFGPWCGPVPACDASPPDPGAPVGWNELASDLIVLTGSPNHRIRDMFYLPGDPQWLIGKFSYGLTDKDLKGEFVDVYVLRGCEGDWEFLGTAETTFDGDHPAVEGVEDSGGRVYFPIPADKALGLGRHRIHMVVKGDLSTVDGFVEVVEPGTPIVLTDVDGTLTSEETAEFTALLTGQTPDAHPGAAEVFQAFSDKGYHVMYLTARPEYLVERTREFVTMRGFPEGILHTTTSLTGATGAAAVAFKTDELARLADRALLPVYVVGNTATDAEAYDNAMVSPLENRIFFQYTDAFGGRRIDDYYELLPEIEGAADLCR